MKFNALKYSVFSLLACVTAGISASASEAIVADQISVEVVADDGRVFARYDLESHSQRGLSRAYLEAERQRNYGIRVRNHTAGRIGVVIAVDGRNIISGQESNLLAGEAMYVLGAYQQATYEGWRTSDSNVQRFIFTDADNSYAEAWGDRSAMGVIAVSAFREVQAVQPQRRSGRQSMAPSATMPSEAYDGKSRESADAAGVAGTGFGDSHASRSVHVHFSPQRHAFAKHFLKYEWHASLVRLGIIRQSPPLNRFWPEQIGQARGFAPYPPGYRR